MAAVPGQKKKSKKTKIPPRDTLTEGQVRQRAHIAFCAVWGAQCSPVLPPVLGSVIGPCARSLRQRTEPLTRCAMGAQKKEIEEAFDILDTDGSGEMLCFWHSLPAEAELGSRAGALCAYLCVRACVCACA